MPGEQNTADGIYQVNGTNATSTVNSGIEPLEPLMENQTEGNMPKEYGIKSD